jgi:hypothetical protein
MDEHSFMVHAPFESVAIVLELMENGSVREADDRHAVAVFPEGGSVLVRPVWPDVTEVVVTQVEGALLAKRSAVLLHQLLACHVTLPKPVARTTSSFG